MDERAVSAADELARLVGDERGTRILAALQRLQAATRPPAAPAPAGARRAGRPRTVGLWDIVDSPAGPALRRRPNQPLWEECVWSGAGDVPGKGGRTRVVLLGESVARGYLLDPVFNPGLALRHHLDAAGTGRYQFVDLARTSMRLAALHTMVRGVPHLDTDVLVMFAGNNWVDLPDELSRDQLAGLAGTLRAGGYHALRDAVLREATLPKVEALLRELLRLRARHGVMPVVVIPEFNLAGWSPVGSGAGREMELPTLPEDALRRWHELWGRASAAERDGDWTAIASAARAMIELDEGTSPVPGYLLGRALAATGDRAGARAAYEQSRDSVSGQLGMYLPRCPRTIQDFMREFCGRHDIACVDLPALLAPDGGPPDPELFLDYCHLSDAGVTRAMAEVARRITGQAGGTGPEPTLRPWDRAVSLVLAGAYNSFCGQPAEIVRRYLDRALAACPEAAGLMRALAGVLDRPGGPLWSGIGFDEVIRQPNMATIFERLGEYRPGRSRVWTLRESLAAALGTVPAAEPDVPSGGDRRPEELLDIASTLLGLGAVANHTEPRCYLQANTRQTKIKFGLPGPRPGVLRLVHRRREGRPDPVVVRLNGAPLGEFVAGPGWATTEFAVPDGLTAAGINVIEVRWPGPAVGHATRLAEDVDALTRAEAPYVLPIFGELFSVTFDRYRAAPAAPVMAG